jgi:hypothetical protein
MQGSAGSGRFFGSKESLFSEALGAAVQITDLLQGSAGGLAGRSRSAFFQGGRGFDIVVRSLSSPEASPVIRQFILNDSINSLAEKLDRASTVRIALNAALLARVAIFGSVLLALRLAQQALEHECRWSIVALV